MAIDAAERFLLTEVAKSTGLSYATVQSQMITLGILGEYIARMYIQEKNRPIYIAKEMITVSPEEESGSGPAAPSTGTDRSGNRR